ncbi:MULTISPECIES: AbrB/MazE/SpoVT family DNA-binding domain-containing protein [unclassified Paenibacillus]|uniref:AbrB/MazE/SpoVT family DNA-binding domain-containing protein n=1 Tax=unclassified Paenibacillus TaxID=185978 RepID=UPI00277D907C|nr:MULTISPECIES: AbrB/MazE/SpoVT family DNA-binding domain-containing protein [unclassified Paenibacillus]MDQ0896395.1 AbrB family looped-hinge helix DNA binding protein [Paenibacillus sp. V4I7]MDQ0914061.1 AbrB family looped-hinge helix DNA binding protein [Paenibacillus sp. V4I5]
MFKSTITSKGQLTVPKEIRELLNLNTGDGVVFKVNDARNIVVTFEKDEEVIECPICKGFDPFYFNANYGSCFLCDQTKYVNAKISAWQQIGMIKSIKYGVSVSVIQHEKGSNGEFIQSLIPKVKLYSKKYSEELLDIAHDYLQMKYIVEYAPRNQFEPEKFMNLTEIILDEILALLKSEAAKEESRRWFINLLEISQAD